MLQCHRDILLRWNSPVHIIGLNVYRDTFVDATNTNQRPVSLYIFAWPKYTGFFSLFTWRVLQELHTGRSRVCAVLIRLLRHVDEHDTEPFNETLKHSVLLFSIMTCTGGFGYSF